MHRSKVLSFDHLVGKREQRRRDRQAERPGGLQVDDHLELGRLHHWQVGRLLTSENPSEIDTGLAIAIREMRPVTDKTTRGYEFLLKIDRWQGMKCRQRDKLIAAGAEERISPDDDRSGMLVRQSREGRVDLAFGAGGEHDGSHAEAFRR